jgi:hypothetical protein
MARLPTFGVSLMTPCRDQAELKGALSELCGGMTFEDVVVHEYYVQLALLIGEWLAEQARLETSPVKKALITLAENLTAASASLGGLEIGFRDSLEIETTARVHNLLALDPSVGSPDAARDLLHSFKRYADTIAHACMIAGFDLPSGPGKRGRKEKDWYGSFTELLLKIAKKASIRPMLYQDRAVDRPSVKSWLLEAARELESFLPAEMRSQSDVARYKRLQRSKAILSKARGQNSPSR